MHAADAGQSNNRHTAMVANDKPGQAKETTEEQPRDMVLGGEDRQVILDGIDNNKQVMLSMLQQAKREVLVCSLILDPQLLDNNEAISALRTAIVNNRNFRLRAIVYNPTLMTKTGHRLLEFVRGKTSFCSLRVPSQQHASYDQALFLVDDIAFIHRPKSDYWRGAANFNDVPKVQRYKETFETIWSSAEPDQELRQFRI